MTDMAMLLIKALVLGCVVTAVLGFILIKFLSKSTETAVTRLNKETEVVRAKQSELNAKIKDANEELSKRRAEADALVIKMKQEAEEKAKEEREKILKKAREEGDEIIAKAQRTKDDVRKVLEQEASIKAVDFGKLLLEEILAEKIKGFFNEALIDEFLDNLEEVDMSMIDKEINTIDVLTPLALSEKEQERLTNIVKKKLNRDIKINSAIDPKCIGGIILKFGSLSLDASLHHLLEEHSINLKERIEKGLLAL